ncbi:MAG: hypothetical protein A2293_00390 [Elusimicrobia bacterium RIFOXYB2_FULL_49_7]|nr:MAG: hypothetical protein A2293_00390 [Elusimicrobia bacterium RIFOXYB2_FULL_49_7]
MSLFDKLKARMHYLFGIKLINKAEYASAVNEITTAISVSPKPEYYKNRGYAQLMLGNLNEAYLDLNHVIGDATTTITDPTAYYIRGNIYTARREYSLALRDYKEAMQLKPKYHDAMNNAATVCEKLKKKDEALQYYGQAIKATPGNGAYLFNRGTFYWETNRRKEAVADFERAARLGDKDAQAALKRVGKGFLITKSWK